MENENIFLEVCKLKSQVKRTALLYKFPYYAWRLLIIPILAESVYLYCIGITKNSYEILLVFSFLIFVVYVLLVFLANVITRHVHRKIFKLLIEKQDRYQELIEKAVETERERLVNACDVADGKELYNRILDLKLEDFQLQYDIDRIKYEGLEHEYEAYKIIVLYVGNPNRQINYLRKLEYEEKMMKRPELYEQSMESEKELLSKGYSVVSTDFLHMLSKCDTEIPEKEIADIWLNYC